MRRKNSVQIANLLRQKREQAKKEKLALKTPFFKAESLNIVAKINIDTPAYENDLVDVLKKFKLGIATGERIARLFPRSGEAEIVNLFDYKKGARQ